MTQCFSLLNLFFNWRMEVSKLTKWRHRNEGKDFNLGGSAASSGTSSSWLIAQRALMKMMTASPFKSALLAKTCSMACLPSFSAQFTCGMPKIHNSVTRCTEPLQSNRLIDLLSQDLKAILLVRHRIFFETIIHNVQYLENVFHKLVPCKSVLVAWSALLQGMIILFAHML